MKNAEVDRDARTARRLAVGGVDLRRRVTGDDTRESARDKATKATCDRYRPAA